MGQNMLLVRLTSPRCSHIPSRFSRSCSVLRSLTVQTPRFLVLQWGESAAAERGGADRHYTALQAQSYLYSVYRFTLTHHGAGRSIKIAAAYHWKKKERNLLILCVSDINKQKANQSFTYDSWLCNRHPFVCILTSHIAYIFCIFINPIFFQVPTQNANQMSPWPHIYTMHFFNNYAKQKRDHQLPSKPQADKSEFAHRAVLSAALFSVRWNNPAISYCRGMFHRIRITTVISDSTV